MQGREHIGVSITAHHPAQPGWTTPAAFYFRKNGSAWELVGVDRQPEGKGPIEVRQKVAG
jgi:hypothetical protein